MNLPDFIKKSRLGVILFFLALSPSFAQTSDKPLKLHYDSPAKYFEEALVIGNGTIGAVVYGGTSTDRISLNDITLWTGEPDKKAYNPDAYKAIPEIRELLDKEDYKGADEAQKKVQGHYSENYQPLGTFTIEYLDSAKVSSYQRYLDISNAVANVSYQRNGKSFSSEYFASAPDSAIIIRIKSESTDGIHAKFTFNSLLPHNTKIISDNTISAEGYAAYKSLPVYTDVKEKFLYDPNRGIHFRTIIKVLSPDATFKANEDNSLEISGCKEIILQIVNATSFNGFDKDPVKEGKDYKAIAENRSNNLSKKSYENLRSTHIADYKSFFDRLSLWLGNTDEQTRSLPTDVQLRQYVDENIFNPELEALYFQYGRYLLISCSRTSGVPANLQGLWNESILPPWSCNYTSNINLEENYWAAETANLSELHQPLMDFIKNLSSTGSITAQSYYGVDKGWCLAHNTDIWAMTCPVGLNSGDPSWACWNMGGAWVSTHIWERYQFTQDKQFLAEAYPLLKGAADFCMNWLIEKDGKLITSPGTSPENKFITPQGYVGATSYGSMSDLAMIRECLIDTRLAAETLGLDKDYIKKIKEVLSKLQPYKIGSKGNLQEWFYDWRDQDPQHRHQSHLFGLYPGHHLSITETPELAKACARTLEIKGDNTTGWSTGWRVNLYARLRDSKRAYHIFRKLLNYISPDNYKGSDARRGGGTYPNLLDAHSPFQIDGNFGGCAGVIEMLIQSTSDTITTLPALPEKWKEGQLNGVCARGGYIVDLGWKDGSVTSLSIYSRNGGKTNINCNGKTYKVKLKKGERKQIKLDK